jgi:UDP-N-acetylmuramoylalanine--D-glutamate ligase
MDFTGKHIAVVGYGVEGKATAEYLKQHGAEVSVRDANSELTIDDRFPSQVGVSYLDDLEGFDLIFRSPSIRPELLSSFDTVTTATQFFLDHCRSVTIGVTGTKGKGTTSTLIMKLLESIGHKAWLGGNIGTPKLSFLDEIEKTDVVVLELSSFQLIDCSVSPDIAVCLMIEPDHLNWHTTMEEYIEAKAHITSHQNENDVFIHHPTNENVQKIVSLSTAGQKVAFMQPQSAHITNGHIMVGDTSLMPVHEVGMIGSHNLENICAALTALYSYAQLADISLTDKLGQITQCIRDFKGLEHRLEFVREHEGVRFFNDSFSVMPAATIAGIAAFSEPVIAIVGGVDKKISYDAMAAALTACKFVVIIGEIAPYIQAVFDEKDYTQYVVVNGNMTDIVAEAQKQSEAGDVVLLSPGSSSYDMFTSYKDRGDQFKKVVLSL